MKNSRKVKRIMKQFNINKGMKRKLKKIKWDKYNKSKY